jgi:predicted nucleic acid-binding protein
LDGLIPLTLPENLFAAAGRLEPVELRSWDALHLAAARELGDDRGALVVCDERRREAARSNGIEAIAPT